MQGDSARLQDTIYPSRQVSNRLFCEGNLRLRVVCALPPDICNREVEVVVDNTTVKGVARKGACLKSQVLNQAVVKALEYLRSQNCLFSISWVRSADNPADIPSRVPLNQIPGEFNKITQAVRRFITGVVADS